MLGSDTDFPADLLELQQRRYAAEPLIRARGSGAAFAAVGAEPPSHPYWAGVENRHTATVKLEQAARPDTAQEPTA
ncbi:hypothetical protein ACWEQL_26100 [Kitasatospora sp. NPDC004240]